MGLLNGFVSRVLLYCLRSNKARHTLQRKASTPEDLSLAESQSEILNPSMVRTGSIFFAAVLFISKCLAQESPAPSVANAQVGQLIPWLLNEDRQLTGIPFSDVILAATGKHVLRVDMKNEADQRVIKQVSGVLDGVMKRMNTPENPVQNVGRINEVSSHFENALRELLNTTEGLSCDFPRTADNKVQRSGYPDLRIVDLASKKIYYLDPKLYAAGSRESSFRTFYFEPKVATNKVRDDAVHLVAGFEHEARKDGRWNFTRWDLVDLAQFKVKLKAEFQGSNRDMYRAEAIVATSGKKAE
jgi:hypothetical protein